MARRGLAAAIGPSGRRGESYEIHVEGPLAEEALTTYGLVRGPAVVEQVIVGSPATTAPRRIMGVALPVHVGRLTGTNLRNLLHGGIGLFRTFPEAELRWEGFFAMDELDEVRFWPRVLVPWPVWAPGVWFRRVPAVSGDRAYAHISVSFPD